MQQAAFWQVASHTLWLTKAFQAPNMRLHTVPSECRMQHEQAAGIHRTHQPNLCLPLPALGTPWPAANPSVHHLAAMRSAAPVRFAEPATQQQKNTS